MQRTGFFNREIDENKKSALTKEERTRLNKLWNSTERLSKEDYIWMKQAEKRMLRH